MLNTGRSDLRFLDMPWTMSNRIVQNAAQFCFSPTLGKSLNIVEKIDGLSLVDSSFAPRDSPRQAVKKNG